MSERLRISELVRGGFRPTAPLMVSAIAATVAVIAIGFGVRDLVSAAFTSSVSESEADPLTVLTEEGTKSLVDARKRFDGRSVFVMPSAPVRKAKAPPAPLVPPPPPPDPGPPPPPSSYTGPAPTSVMGDTVFFASMNILKGQTVNGVTVLETNAPWNVKLGYMRGEYTVDVWSRGAGTFFSSNPYPFNGSIGITSVATAATTGKSTTGAGTSGSGAAGTATAGPGSSGSPRPDGKPTASGSNGSAGSTPTATGTPSAPGTAKASAANPTPVRGGSPPLAAPGDEPGADQPQGPGPGEERLPGQSPAMQPLELPPPPPAPENNQTYVDASTLPPAISDDRISMMDMATARTSLGAIDATNSLNVDPDNRDRLENERTLLLARIQVLQGGGQP